MKHTPGPWILSDDGDGCVELYLSENASVSDIYRAIHRIELYDGLEEAGGDYDEARANARLIAAAPDLLEALNGMIEKSITKCWFDRLNPCWDNRPTDRPGLHWGSTDENQVRACHICIARAAIAKAEGRQ